MKIKGEGKLLDRVFEIGILIKAFFGFFELLAGILFAVSGRRIVDNFIISIAQQEIVEDPNDLLANYLISLASEFSLSTQIFASFYLISHGIVNIFLAVFLLKGKLWAYPSAITFFGIFVIYQVYRYFNSHSFILLMLILFDIFVISIIWLEYRRKKRRRQSLSQK